MAGTQPFTLRAVTYGTFRPRDDGERFPERDVIKQDFDAISAAGFNTVRTYTLPSDDVIELAGEWDLRLLAGVFYEDWRFLAGASARGPPPRLPVGSGARGSGGAFSLTGAAGGPGRFPVRPLLA